jgi:hypothetical protein
VAGKCRLSQFVLLPGTCIGSFEVPLAELYAIMGGKYKALRTIRVQV